MSGGTRPCAGQGGKGGWGNKHFATPPARCQLCKGWPARSDQDVILELKLLADVGLVGISPNVGKSTLLSVVSKAQPRSQTTTLPPSSPT